MKNFEAAKKIFRIDIHINKQEGKSFLSQQKFIKKMMERFSTNMKFTST